MRLSSDARDRLRDRHSRVESIFQRDIAGVDLSSQVDIKTSICLCLDDEDDADPR